MTRGGTGGGGLLLSQVSGLGTEEEGEGHMKEGERERFPGPPLPRWAFRAAKKSSPT